MTPARWTGDARPDGVPGRSLRQRLAAFVARWGWRAWALPLLTVATVVVLVELARRGG